MKEIMERFGKLSVYENRLAGDDYCELVFFTKDTPEWEKVLTDILGSGIKPPQTPLGKEDVRLAAEYGGVHSGQTFFKKEIDSSVVIAMFWPWQDAEHTTLKIAFTRK